MHGYKADVYGFLALRGHPAALVSTCHTWYDNDLALRLYGMLDRLVLRRFARVAAVSQQVQQQLLQAGVSPQKVRLIRNGVDLSLWAAAIPSLALQGRPLVGLVGRLAQEKGVDLFLRAAANVLRHLPEVRFVIVGEGPDRTNAGSPDKGTTPARPSHPAGQDVTTWRRFMPRWRCSCPLRARKACRSRSLRQWASGLAIVATDVGEVPSLIVDGETGLLVTTQAGPETTVQSLTAAIVRLIEDAAMRERLGSAARALVEEKFSARQMTADYLSLYQDALAEDHAG